MKKELESLESEPETQQPVNRRKEQVRESAKADYKLWQVLRVALILPVLEKSSVRDFSPLKTLLVDWGRSVRRLVPMLGVGAMASQMPPASAGLPEVAGYKYTGQKCSLIHFC